MELIAVESAEAAKLTDGRSLRAVRLRAAMPRDEFLAWIADEWCRVLFESIEAGRLAELLEVAAGRPKLRRGGSWRSRPRLDQLPARLEVVEFEGNGTVRDAERVRSRMQLGAVRPDGPPAFALSPRDAQLALSIPAAHSLGHTTREQLAGWRIVAPLDTPNCVTDSPAKTFRQPTHGDSYLEWCPDCGAFVEADVCGVFDERQLERGADGYLRPRGNHREGRP